MPISTLALVLMHLALHLALPLLGTAPYVDPHLHNPIGFLPASHHVIGCKAALDASLSYNCQMLTSHRNLLKGGAPEGVEYVDQEEEYVVDPVTGEGRWVAVGTGNVPLAPPPLPGVRPWDHSGLCCRRCYINASRLYHTSEDDPSISHSILTTLHHLLNTFDANIIIYALLTAMVLRCMPFMPRWGACMWRDPSELSHAAGDCQVPQKARTEVEEAERGRGCRCGRGCSAGRDHGRRGAVTRLCYWRA